MFNNYRSRVNPYIMSTRTGLNIISGKVIFEDTGVGIPELAVVIYGLDLGTRPEAEFRTNPETGTPESSYKRTW
jgi:hypothetical protein